MKEPTWSVDITIRHGDKVMSQQTIHGPTTAALMTVPHGPVVLESEQLLWYGYDFKQITAHRPVPKA